MQHIIPESELIINPDGSIYHLNIKADDLASDIITVGDPDRVDMVAQRLDKIHVVKHKREFKTVTGSIGDRDLTIISTGIGTDNIDIVFTELDALVNVDLLTRQKLENHHKLRFYRLGTSGALRPEIEMDSTIISKHALGLEGLMHYYQYKGSVHAQAFATAAHGLIKEALPNVIPYGTSASSDLMSKFQLLGEPGVTVTATGFYGPQGREVIAKPKHRTFVDQLATIVIEGLAVTNLEMETAGIYGMATLLGHEAISFNAILANRAAKTFSTNPKKTVENLVDRFFETF